MSRATVPEQGAEAHPRTPAPKFLLQQMEELMAALNADPADLDADLQPSGGSPSAREDTSRA
ncbi:MAG: hypothetical protein QOI83_4264 [Streptomycetaceae bacterium]|jgi:hypothetical protein|nr:hypothetical protein [Streptomycetaceae bacterium]